MKVFRDWLGRALLAALLAAAPPALAADADVAAPAPAPAEAPADTPPQGDEILVRAEHLERRAHEHLVVGEGAVDIRHGDLRLRADRIVINEETKDVIADGNIVMDSGPDRLQGEHLELNLDTRTGFLTGGQGFVESYYLTGERIDKLGEDRYFIRDGSFTTCEGTLPAWRFRSTSASLQIDHYLHAWNPSMWVRQLPVFYLPYAVFPVKRDRATGLLVPEIRYRKLEGMIVRGAFYWAPLDNFDATVRLDWLQREGWGQGLELRYLLGAGSHGQANGYYLRNQHTGAESWAVSSSVQQALPLGVRGQAELFMQSDRTFIRTRGSTLEERSTERDTASVYLNRSWSAWDLTLAAQHDVSLLTEKKTTQTRLPELTLNRTSNRFFDTNLFWKLSLAGAELSRETETRKIETTRVHVSPELSWPIALGGWGSLVPTAGHAGTWYRRGLDGEEIWRSVPYYRLGLEGPRFYRVFDLEGGKSRVEKLKHLIEPRVGYVYSKEVDQANVPQFDSLDTIPASNRIEYSLTNTLYAKVVPPAPPPGVAPAQVPPPTAPAAPSGAGTGLVAVTPAGAAPEIPLAVSPPEAPVPTLPTEELFWFKLSQSYDLAAEEVEEIGTRPFSPVEWEVRARPHGSLDLWWKGNFGVYGEGVGYQNVSLDWKPLERTSFRGEWRTAKGTDQDFLDVGTVIGAGGWEIEGRSRYNLGAREFVENRIGLKYVAQCWDVGIGYVKWPDQYEYRLQITLKGIGTILKI